MLSGKLWPAHPHPYPDELLSSWLVRVAHANGLKVQTFCHLEFGLNHQVWNRDIDRLAPDWILERMGQATGLPVDSVRSTTLLPYLGCLYLQRPSSGQLRWILPLKIYHRMRHGFGLQYCPQCLADDQEPYFRRAWRVAFYTFCPRHNVMLQDRCPVCGSGVAFHRLGLGRSQLLDHLSLSICAYCDFDLRQAIATLIENGDDKVFYLWRKALMLTTGNRGSEAPSNPNYLDVLHHFCKLCTSRRLAPQLRAYLCAQKGNIHVSLAQARMLFEQRSVSERHHVFGLALWLLDQWPARLLQAYQDHAVRYNELLKDFDNPPDWYSQTVHKLTPTLPEDRTYEKNQSIEISYLKP